MAHDPTSHVMDTVTLPDGSHPWYLFEELFNDKIAIYLPNIFGFQVTKFMVLEVIAAALILLIYVPLARRARTGALPKGAWWNAFEVLLTFVRNQIAKPNLDPPAGHHGHGDPHGHKEHAHEPPPPSKEGGHGEAGWEDHAHAPREHQVPGLSEADKYVPFLWTIFLFVLFCNLLGMIPFMGSPTASIWVTGALALCSFLMLHGAAVVRMGPLKYLKSLWPRLKIDVPVVGVGLGLIISILLCFLEVFGTVIKSGVLAIRLFANMFAGHMVLATILLFIVTVGHATHGPNALWGTVSVASVLGVTALSLLELFVAFLQAYVFTFLTALFMGMSLYPQH
jgi:F-type H+-transporting ATPase subunit a